MPTAAKRNSRGDKVDDATKPSDYRKYYNSNVLSDIIIRYSGRVFHGHKVVLAHEAAWFETAFQNDRWLESTAKEITLEDDDPDALEGMFKYMYNIDPQPFQERKPDDSDLEVDQEDLVKELTTDRVRYCIELFRVADKYNCGSLMEAAPQMFHREFRQTTRAMSNYVFRYRQIERPIDWKKQCAMPAETLREIAEAVYELQDAWMQEGRSPITSNLLTQLFSIHTFSPIADGLGREAVLKAAKEVPQLGSDLFMEIMGRKSHGMKQKLKPGWQMCSRLQCAACKEIYPVPEGAEPRYCMHCGHKLH